MSQNDATWTARVSPEIKDYLQNKKGMSAGRCLREYFRILKSQELPGLLQERRKLLERVTQIDEIVTQLKIECVTNWGICDTLFSDLSKQGEYFNLQNVTEDMKDRILTRLKKKGIENITVEEFVEHYKQTVK